MTQCQSRQSGDEKNEHPPELQFHGQEFRESKEIQVAVGFTRLAHLRGHDRPQKLTFGSPYSGESGRNASFGRAAAPVFDATYTKKSAPILHSRKLKRRVSVSKNQASGTPRIGILTAGGDTNRPALNVGQNQEQDRRQFYLVVPSPTSVHAPPPPIATRVNVTEPPPSNSAEAKPVEPPAPGEDCAGACKSAFSSCNMACDPAAKSAACKSCDPDYKKCMARCFE